MRRLVLVFLAILGPDVSAGAGEKSDLRVLYVGGASSPRGQAYAARGKQGFDPRSEQVHLRRCAGEGRTPGKAGIPAQCSGQPCQEQQRGQRAAQHGRESARQRPAHGAADGRIIGVVRYGQAFERRTRQQDGQCTQRVADRAFTAHRPLAGPGGESTDAAPEQGDEPKSGEPEGTEEKSEHAWVSTGTAPANSAC